MTGKGSTPIKEVDLKRFIVERLAEGEQQADIVYVLCEKTGWSWPKAEEFFRRVQAGSEGEVARKQFPLLLVLGFGIFLGGVALTGYGIFGVIESYRTARDFIATGDLPPLDVWSHIRLIFDSGVSPFYAILTGVTMIIGSMIGMRKAWGHILFRDETPE